MARDMAGNKIEDEVITIPIADYQEYISLLSGREIIYDRIERERSCDIMFLLSCLGGARGRRLYDNILDDLREKTVRENTDE